MSTVYLNTKAFCKLTPVFELVYCVASEEEDPVKSITIDRNKKYNISAYKDETGQLLDYVGKIVRVNIRYNPNNAFIPLDASESDIQIVSILLDCSSECSSKMVMINVCDIRAISEYEENSNPGTDDNPDDNNNTGGNDKPGDNTKPDDKPSGGGDDNPGGDSGDNTDPGNNDNPSGGGDGGNTEEPKPEPTPMTVYAGLLPTLWTPDRDDTIDLTADDVTPNMIKALTQYTQTGKATTIESIAIDGTPCQWAYAYPKVWGTLSHIKGGGFDYISNFIKKELTINGVEYYVYFNSSSAMDDMVYEIS